MDGIREILPSYLDAATQEEKRIFFVAFIAVILDKVKFLDILELTYSKISFWIL